MLSINRVIHNLINIELQRLRHLNYCSTEKVNRWLFGVQKNKLDFIGLSCCQVFEVEASVVSFRKRRKSGHSCQITRQDDRIPTTRAMPLQQHHEAHLHT